MDVVYANLCPICLQDLEDHEISSSTCSKFNVPLCYQKDDPLVYEFLEFFEKCIGSEARAIQRMWARRILRNESFALTAPTGVGKTSFGIVMALFLALKGKSSYLIFPTSALVKQSVENLKKYSEGTGVEISFNDFKGIPVGYYLSVIKKDEKREFIEKIKDFRILLTTTQFLSRNFEIIKGKTFDFIFVDDVDSVLKASRNVDRILQLLGFYWEKGWKGESRGTLVVSTATAKKGKKARLFRELLNFDVGSSRLTVRNIEDVAVEGEDLEKVEEVMRKLGSGGLIYTRTGEEALKIHEKFKDEFRIGIVFAGKGKDLDRFASGELDYLIGTSYYYGTLVRGIDLPERAKYSIFIGCPVFKIKFEEIDTVSPKILKVLALIYKKKPEIEPFVVKLNKIEEDLKLQEEIRKVLKEIVGSEIEAKDVILKEKEIIFPDVRTYIQASGRTSRLFAGGITKGVSFLFEKDEDVLKAFIERAKFFDIEFKKLEDVDFESLKREIEESRIKRKRDGEVIRPALFIVESPTKAKQISKFFGKPSVKIIDGVVVYEIPMEKYVLLITASLGHLTDLITNRSFHGVEVNEKFVPIYASIKKCKDCNHQFTEERKDCPRCGSEKILDSKERIEVLRKLAKDSGFVIIGTDPDSEGEKIAWDISNLLSGCGEIKRAEFHEVTRRAILEALDSLRDIEDSLVKAQIARRVEDRWIGFVLSQKLWGVFEDKNLSAGRAQTPVLGWVINRYDEAKRKKSIAIVRDLDIVLEHDKKDFEVEINLIDERSEERNPLPPYTTDSMLKDANTILKLSVVDAMKIAQELFELGLITYHRTDSTRISEVGLRIAKDYLGDEFFARNWYSEGAHECIRPTKPIDKETLQRLIEEKILPIERLSWRHYALYDLIFRRFMASQCKPMIVKVKTYEVRYDGKKHSEERVVDVKGKAYELYKSIWVRQELPVGRFKVKAEVKKVQSVPLYSQSDVISLMKTKGIGRPSTYATILDKLFIRGYVVEKGGKIIPTKRGIVVYDYLAKNYWKFINEERTRSLEEKMDLIERGYLDLNNALRELYEEVKQIE